jgi:site-specific recombinase XerD
MLEDLQIRNYAPTTVAAYTRSIAEFAKHFGKSPDLLGSEQIREYQLYLIKEKRVSLPSYIQAVCALRFFYTSTLHRPVSVDRIPLPRYERKLPVILSPAEGKLLLETHSHRTSAHARGNSAGVSGARPAPHRVALRVAIMSRSRFHVAADRRVE